MKTLKKILVLLLVLSILAGTAYGVARAVQESRRQTVMVIPASAVNYGGYWGDESSLEGMATTSATQSVYISDTEKVDKVLVSEGQAVRKGDVLMTYDATLTKLNLEKAELAKQQLELSLDVAKQNLETLRNMTPYVEPGFDDPEEPDLPEEPEEELPDPYETITAVSVLDENTLSINELVDAAGGGEDGENLSGEMEDMLLPEDETLTDGDDLDGEEDFGGLSDGPGSFTNPYRYLVTDGAVIQPSFIEKMKALAKEAGGSVFFTLEIHEDDTYYGATRASWTLDAASLLEDLPEDWQGRVGLTGIDVGDAEGIAALLEQEKNEKVLSALRTYLEALGLDAEKLAEAENPSVEAAEYKKSVEELKARIEALEKENEDLKTSGTTADGRTVADLEKEIAILKDKIAELGGGDLPDVTPTPTKASDPTPTPTEEATPTPTEEATPTPTEEATPTPTEEATPTPTEEATPVPTGTAEPTPINTATPAVTNAPMAGSAALAGTTPGAATVAFADDHEEAQGTTMAYLVERRPLDGGDAERFERNLTTALADGEDGRSGFILTDIDTGLIPKDAQYTAEEIRNAIKEEEENITMLSLDIREAELGIRAAQKAVDEGMVKAKMNGVITTAGDPASIPSDGSAFLVLTGAAGLYIRSAVPEKLLGSVHEGDMVTVSSWMSGLTLSGEIREISLTPDESGMFGYGSDVTMYPMTIFISGDEDSLEPGEWVQVALEGGMEMTVDGPGEDLYLWKAFIREEGGVKYVYKRGGDGLLVKQEVAVGELSGEGYEILSGVTADDWLAFPYGKEVKEGAETREGSISELYEM